MSRTSSAGDFLGYTGNYRIPSDAPSLGGAPIDFEDLLYQELPDFPEVVAAVIYNSLPFLSGFLSNSEEYAAAATIFNQANNDWHDLLRDLTEGRGRPAIRVSRSLIEHAINLSDVASSEQAAAQYLAHLDVAYEVQYESRIGADLLSKKSRRSYLHRLRRARSAAAPRVEAALKLYGRSFRRSWSGRPLDQRAAQHGLSDLYKSYRLASLVMHGAPGGLLGTVRSIEGKKVYRTGPAIELLPLAYISGTRAYLRVLNLASTVVPELDASVVLQTTEQFLDIWPLYREAVLNVDKKIWPQTPPPRPEAIALISRSGAVRWCWHDRRNEILIEALPPRLSSEMENYLAAIVARTQQEPDQIFRPGDQWVSAQFGQAVVVSPKPGARMVSSRAILLDENEVDLDHIQEFDLPQKTS